jgi:hypothetical protein
VLTSGNPRLTVVPVVGLSCLEIAQDPVVP